MDGFFIHLLNMSITASWLALAVMLLRFLLKKAPRAITVALWALVGVRLLLPFSFESVLSLLPGTRTIPEEIVFAREPMIDSGVTAINAVVNPIIVTSFAPKNELTSINPIQVFFALAELVWIVGMIAMVLYTAVSYLRIRHQVREAIPLRENIYLCDRISTPFILGLLRPRIYLPATIGSSDAEYVIAHEKAHLRRLDHLWKPLGFFLLTIYWFNPVLWAAYILLCRDIELACDERVIRDMDAEDKKAYSIALLNCSIPRRMIAACPLAFGEVGVKQRIKGVLSYKKPAFWLILVAIAASVGMAIGFLTDPKPHTLENFNEDGRFGSMLENVEQLALSYQYRHYLGLTEEETARVIEELKAIEITEKPISAERKEELRGTYSIHINENKKSFLVLCFDEVFEEFWVRDSVKPSLVYGVKDARALREIFSILPMEAVSPTNLPQLRVESMLTQIRVEESARLYMGALNRNKMYISSVQHLPLFKFESKGDLDSFITRYGEDVDFAHDSSLSDAPSFADAITEYGDEFFAQNVLFAVYIFAPQCDNEYKLHSTYTDENSLAFHVVTEKEGMLQAIQEYMLLISVDRGRVSGRTVFDATLDAVDVIEETIVGTWKAPISILGLAAEKTPEDAAVVYVFRADGTGVECVPLAEDKEFTYRAEGKFLTLSYASYDSVMLFSYEQTKDMLRLGDLRSASLHARTLELTRVSYDTPTPLDDVALHRDGETVWTFFTWPNLPDPPKEGIDTLSFSFEKHDGYSVSRGENTDYIDCLRLSTTDGSTYELSFQLFQDAFPYVEPLFEILNSLVTETYEGETFDALEEANAHAVFLINGEPAEIAAVYLGAGNGHRDFYFTLVPAAPIPFKDVKFFEFVIS